MFPSGVGRELKRAKIKVDIGFILVRWRGIRLKINGTGAPCPLGMVVRIMCANKFRFVRIN